VSGRRNRPSLYSPKAATSSASPALPRGPLGTSRLRESRATEGKLLCPQQVRAFILRKKEVKDVFRNHRMV